jgi:hypothetical protein
VLLTFPPVSPPNIAEKSGSAMPLDCWHAAALQCDGASGKALFPGGDLVSCDVGSFGGAAPNGTESEGENRGRRYTRGRTGASYGLAKKNRGCKRKTQWRCTLVEVAARLPKAGEDSGEGLILILALVSNCEDRQGCTFSGVLSATALIGWPPTLTCKLLYLSIWRVPSQNGG